MRHDDEPNILRVTVLFIFLFWLAVYGIFELVRSLF